MSNPFDDDYKHSGKLNDVRSYTSGRTIEDEVQDYEKEIERVLQETVDSTQRSVQRLENSEQLGVNTAQELLAQREKLERTEHNLDSIHATTQETQRSLNSLKSLFGGFFKNKFSRAPKAAPPPPVSVSDSDNKLNAHLNNSTNDSYRQSTAGGPSLTAESRNAIKGTRFEAMDNQIDENLGQMSDQLQRLRNLGQALGSEVDEQNDMLSRIQVKADRNDAVVRSQDNQMKKLLGQKGIPGKPEDTAGLVSKKK